MDLFTNYNNLGFHSPYFIYSSRINTFQQFKKAIKSKHNARKIDLTAIVEILNNNYILGDRTLVHGINKSPWMAYPSSDSSDWIYNKDLPIHDTKIHSQEEIAQTLFKLLQEELVQYVENSERIGILLSGGMDSRIVAGLLHKHMQIRSGQSPKSVVAFTWGLPESRDVVYASRIARKYNWEWIHLEIDKTQLVENITICAESGCEVSPIHLHAIPKISKYNGLDCILAGSFGDSIGRGEYSGKKVTELKKTGNRSRLKNIGNLLRSDYLEFTEDQILNDISQYHRIFPRPEVYQQNELDNQLHYMRRMLNNCMSIINHKTPLHQMFASPKVYGYMWSLEPRLRNDYNYEIILRNYFPELLDIPWARTGLKYPLNSGKPDKFLKTHHKYGELIRSHFVQKLKSDEFKSNLHQLNIFDMDAVENLIKLCSSFPIAGSYYFEERLLWLLSLSKFVKLYEIKSDYNPFRQNKSYKTTISFGARYIKQKILDTL